MMTAAIVSCAYRPKCLTDTMIASAKTGRIAGLRVAGTVKPASTVHPVVPRHASAKTKCLPSVVPKAIPVSAIPAVTQIKCATWTER